MKMSLGRVISNEEGKESAVQYTASENSTVLCTKVQYSSVQCTAPESSTALCKIVKYGAV